MSTKLNPTAVTEATLGDVAFDGTRKRPVVAINDEGQLVVCCRRTAAKHGWKLQGSLHQRTRAAKPAKADAAPAKKLVIDLVGDGAMRVVEGKKPTPAAVKKGGRRATDGQEVAVVTKETLRTIKAARTVLDASVDELLGE